MKVQKSVFSNLCTVFTLLDLARIAVYEYLFYLVYSHLNWITVLLWLIYGVILLWIGRPFSACLLPYIDYCRLFQLKNRPLLPQLLL